APTSRAREPKLGRPSEPTTLAARTKKGPREARPFDRGAQIGTGDLSDPPRRRLRRRHSGRASLSSCARRKRPRSRLERKRAPRGEALRSGCPDLNWGPLRPERSALPGCATPREGTQSSRFRNKRVTLFRLRCRDRQQEGERMNSVILTGNLASDVEVREFGEDKRLATFRLAVDRPSKSDEADFFRIAAWDQQ